MVAIATTLQSWANDECVPGRLSSQSSDHAWKKFANGDGLFYFGGSWLTADLKQIAGKNAGFFLLPRVIAGAPVTTTGSGGNPFAISAKSKNPDMLPHTSTTSAGRGPSSCTSRPATSPPRRSRAPPARGR